MQPLPTAGRRPGHFRVQGVIVSRYAKFSDSSTGNSLVEIVATVESRVSRGPVFRPRHRRRAARRNPLPRRVLFCPADFSVPRRVPFRSLSASACTLVREQLRHSIAPRSRFTSTHVLAGVRTRARTCGAPFTAVRRSSAVQSRDG